MDINQILSRLPRLDVLIGGVIAVITAIALAVGIGVGTAPKPEEPKDPAPIVDTEKPGFEVIDERTVEVTWLINSCATPWHRVDDSGEAAVLITVGYQTKIQEGQACTAVMRVHTEKITLDSDIDGREIKLESLGESAPILI